MAAKILISQILLPNQKFGALLHLVWKAASETKGPIWKAGASINFDGFKSLKFRKL